MLRLFLIPFFLLPGRTALAEAFSRSQLLMGDVAVTITIEDRARRREAAFSAMEEAFREARRLEERISEWRPDSDATRLNRNAGKALVPVGRDMLAVLEKAAEISEITDGAFDITFNSPNRRATWRDVIVLPELGLATLRPGVAIGVSSVAKGVLVDRMSALLKKAGFRKFLVDAGDLYAAGPWTIGIREPGDPGRGDRAVCFLDVKDEAVSTSGQYERPGHLIDPRTRKPARGLKSVTVLAPDSATAGALATGFFVMGAAEGASAAGGMKGVRLLAIGPQNPEEGTVSACRGLSN